MDIAVVILTFDEELNLPECLASVAGMRVLVVDSGSRDRTIEIARSAEAEVYFHPFESHAKQWAWALSNLHIPEPWVLGLDADQRLTEALRASIETELRKPDRGIKGYYMGRRQVFRGKWIRWGGYYPKYLLKLFRKESVRFDEADVVDHHFWVDGETDFLVGDLVEANRKEDDISVWIEKHNRYAAIQAAAEERGLVPLAQAKLLGNPDQRVLFLKRLWMRLPLFFRPFLYFGYRYLFRFGFLDGKQGFVFHFMQGFWYRLVIDIKRDELRRPRARLGGVAG